MRQISGEVYAAAQASTCCDVTGEESPKGRRGNSNSPRDEQPIRSVPEHDEQLDRARLITTNTLSKPAGGG